MVALLRVDPILLLKGLQLFLYFYEVLFVFLQTQADQLRAALLDAPAARDINALIAHSGRSQEIGQALQHVFQQTAHYSARDFDNLVQEVRVQGKTVREVLQIWQASTATVQQRRLQTLIAAQHCSYPQLLPEWLRNMRTEAIQKEAEELKWALHRT